jgi:hypothetical protein
MAEAVAAWNDLISVSAAERISVILDHPISMIEE